MTAIFFSPLSFVAVLGSGMGKNQDPGSGINIPNTVFRTVSTRSEAHQELNAFRRKQGRRSLHHLQLSSSAVFRIYRFRIRIQTCC